MTVPLSTEVLRETVARVVDETLALYDDGRYRGVAVEIEVDGDVLSVQVSTCATHGRHVWIVQTTSTPTWMGAIERASVVEWDVDARRPVA